MFSTILVPLDGSAESNVSLPVARALAQATGGSIWLLRVAPDSVLSAEHRTLHAAGQEVERVASELAAGGGLEVHAVTREGDAAREILHLSQDIHADAIVMRTRGRAGLERAVFGSVAEEVLKQCSVPLVVMRPGGRRVTRFKKLLVPIDGSPGGVVALQMADALAYATGASIELLEVVIPIPMLAYAGTAVSFYDSGWDDEALVAASTYVAGIAERLRARGRVADGQALIASSVPGAIVERAETAHADLIVMSTHALTGPARAILGSVADAVVRTSPCPVLLLKRTDGDASTLNGELEPTC